MLIFAFWTVIPPCHYDNAPFTEGMFSVKFSSSYIRFTSFNIAKQ